MENRLIAVMDLIAGFPSGDTAYIGLFMLDKDLREPGWAAESFRNCFPFLKNKAFAAYA